MQSQLWDVKLHWQVNDSVVVTTEIGDARMRDIEGEIESGDGETRSKTRRETQTAPLGAAAIDTNG